jgi:hypothetical protein
MGVFQIMENYICTITWTTHCNKEEIAGMEKELFKCIKIKVLECYKPFIKL